MSHPVNEAILERHFEDASELNRLELIAELGFSIPEVAMISFDDLAATVAWKRFAKGPNGPC